MSAHDIPAMPDPAEIFAAFTAFHRTGALKAAIELDLFSAIAAGAATADDLARRCGASLRGVRILADFLATGGFSRRRGRATRSRRRPQRFSTARRRRTWEAPPRFSPRR